MAPPKLVGSSGAEKLATASVAVKEAATHRTQQTVLGQVPWGPTQLYLDAHAVLHRTSADQVTREMNHLAEKLANAQGGRSQGKIKTRKIDESCHPPGILTKQATAGEGVRVQAGAPPGPQGRPAREAELRRRPGGGDRRGRVDGRAPPTFAFRPGPRGVGPGAQEAARLGERLVPAQERVAE